MNPMMAHMGDHLQIGVGHLQVGHGVGMPDKHHGQTLTSLLQTPDEDKLPALPNPCKMLASVEP